MASIPPLFSDNSPSLDSLKRYLNWAKDPTLKERDPLLGNLNQSLFDKCVRGDFSPYHTLQFFLTELRNPHLDRSRLQYYLEKGLIENLTNLAHNPDDKMRKQVKKIEAALQLAFANLNNEQLLKLYANIQSKEFQKAIAKKLGSQINYENIFNIVIAALWHKDKFLITRCFNFLNNNADGIHISCSPNNEITLKIEKLNSYNKSILVFFLEDLSIIKFQGSNIIDELIEAKWRFPYVKTIYFANMDAPPLMLSRIHELLPSVKKCVMDEEFYNAIISKQVPSLIGVKIVHLTQGPRFGTNHSFARPIYQLGKVFPHLQFLILERRLQPFSIKTVEGTIHCNLGTLKAKLDLSNLDTSKLHSATKDLILFELVNAYPHLRSLNLKNWVLSDEIICYVAQNLNALTTLNLDTCIPMNNTIMEIAEKLQNLQALYLNRSSITGDTLKYIAQNLKNLTEFRISGTHLKDEDLIYFAQSIKNLRALFINGSTSLTDVAVIRIAQYLKNLEVLVLSGCVNLTDRIVMSIVDLKKITHLDLSGCPQLTNIAHQALTERFPKKRKIDPNKTL